MVKYLIIVSLLTLMITSISIIDMSSNKFEPSDELALVDSTIYATGIVEGATEDIQLRPEVSGRVTEVLASAGDWVEAGDVLIRLDDRRQRQQVVVSRANLDLADAQLARLINGARPEERQESRALYRAKRAQLEQALRTWNRIQELHKQRAVSQEEADNQQGVVDTLTAELDAEKARVEKLEAPARADELQMARARVAAAVAEQELANIALSKTELRAPRSGRILDVDVEPGELTGPDAMSPVVVLSDTSTLRVRAYVEEIDAPRIQIGMAAKISADGLPGHTFHGKISFLSPRMATKSAWSDRPEELYDTKVREVVVNMEDTTELLVGLRVDVTFNTGNETEAALEIIPGYGTSDEIEPDRETLR